MNSRVERLNQDLSGKSYRHIFTVENGTGGYLDDRTATRHKKGERVITLEVKQIRMAVLTTFLQLELVTTATAVGQVPPPAPPAPAPVPAR
jgi:hypothetical protein